MAEGDPPTTFCVLPSNFNITILLFLFVGYLVLKVSDKPHSIQNLISYPSILSVFRLTAVWYGKYSFFFFFLHVPAFVLSKHITI